VSPKNLLFIFSDQHAQRVARCYGDAIAETPHLDRLAREGVTFDNAYCPSPLCVPSRMSALTGRWPHRQECWTGRDMLRSDIPAWTHGLGAAGYRPTLVGRLDAVGPDQLHGYADRLVGEHSPNWPGIDWEPQMGVLAGANEPDPRSLRKTGAGMSIYQLKDCDATDAAVGWIRNNARERAQADGGFCLTVGYMLPHPPYVADADAYRRYVGRVPPPRLRPSEPEHPYLAWWRRHRGIDVVTADRVDSARAAYWALVHRLDEMVGSVIDALEAIGLLDETLVVYSSDHGDHLGERGLWWKHTFYDESAKVPLIMRFPDVLPAGERRRQVVNLTDLSQTFLEAMGAPPLPGADARSLWTIARDGSAPWDDTTFCEYCTDPIPEWNGRAVQQRMIRSERWKLVDYDSEPVQLFDLESDPFEEHDLATDADHAEIRAKLLARLYAGWDAADIAARMRGRAIEKDYISAWARMIQPQELHKWLFEPDQNRVERRRAP
jgi:choline-sulfatase